MYNQSFPQLIVVKREEDVDQIISLVPQVTRLAGQQRGPRLTARDVYALRWIAEQTAIRFDHLQRLLAQQSGASERLASPEMLSEHSTRRILRRWMVEGLVAYKIFRVREKGWIWLAERGFTYIGLECAYQEPLPSAFDSIFSQNEERLLQVER